MLGIAKLVDWVNSLVLSKILLRDKVKRCASTAYHSWRHSLSYSCIRILMDIGTRQLVRVPLEICTNVLGFSYSRNGWHYYTALLREFDEHQDHSVGSAFLYGFYELYRPETFPQFIVPPGYSLTRTPSLMDTPWFRLTIDHTCDDVHQCGPRSSSAIDADVRRMWLLYEKFRAEGYRPFRSRDGFIRGFFLVRNSGERRFIVTGGQRRCAVLSHLGYKSAWMKLQPGYPHYVRESEVDNWKMVSSGQWSKSDALAYFDLMFLLDGKERASAMGFLS